MHMGEQPNRNVIHRASELFCMRQQLCEVIDTYRGEGGFTAEEVIGCLQILSDILMDEVRATRPKIILGDDGELQVVDP